MFSMRRETPPPVSTSAASQARPTMYPLAMPFKLSGQTESRSAVPELASSRQAGAPIKSFAWSSSEAVGRRSCRAERDQSRVRASTRGSNAPSLAIIQRSDSCKTSNNSRDTLIGLFRVACQRLNSLPGS